MDRTPHTISGDSFPELLLCQFARSPQAGSVKTRLIPALGAEGACRLHEMMMQATWRTLLGSDLGSVELWVDGDRQHPLLLAAVAEGVSSVHAQCGEDLGLRMSHCIERALQRADGVILVGSDCPALQAGHILEIAGLLQRYEVVLAPALDGGYVAIAMRRHQRELFTAMPWGSDQVCAETCARLDALGVSWSSIDPLPDVDREEDLHSLPVGFL